MKILFIRMFIGSFIMTILIGIFFAGELTGAYETQKGVLKDLSSTQICVISEKYMINKDLEVSAWSVDNFSGMPDKSWPYKECDVIVGTALHNLFVKLNIPNTKEK